MVISSGIQDVSEACRSYVQCVYDIVDGVRSSFYTKGAE